MHGSDACGSCMQHDDSASLTMEGVLLSASGGAPVATSLATSKVACAEALMPPGWNAVSIQYASKAGQARHHLRMSLHSPLLVEERYPGRFIIHYENAGALGRCRPISCVWLTATGENVMKHSAPHAWNLQACAHRYTHIGAQDTKGLNGAYNCP